MRGARIRRGQDKSAKLPGVEEKYIIDAMDYVTAGSAAAREYVHSFRRNFLCRERTYRLRPDGLEWRDDKAVHLVRYGDIVEIHEYKGKVRGVLSAQLPRSFDYVLRCRDGEKLVLNSIHHPRFGVAESRASSCTVLVDELRRRVAAANPGVQSFNDLRWSYKLGNAATRLWYRGRPFAVPADPAHRPRPHREFRGPGGAMDRAVLARPSHRARQPGGGLSADVRHRDRAHSLQHVGEPRPAD